MLEQLNQTVKFIAFFTANKQGKTGLTVTVDIYNPDGTLAVTAGTAIEMGDGLYSYSFGGTTTTGDYLAVFKTADSTVDMQWIPSMWCINRAGIADLDASISSRATQNSVNNIPTNPLLTNDSRLNNLDAKISSISGGTAGKGAITWQYLLTLADNVTPIPDCKVWVTSDINGNNVLASGMTDQYGKVVFYLDAGTVYVWCAKSGYNFNNPDTEVVS